MDFKVHLDFFEGPLDLLLFFIRRDEIDIYDIPIARITREYIDYIDTMRDLNIQLAGEFITMAATLIRIKLQTLLPRYGDTVEEEYEDPRNELTRMLIEYQRFKEAGEQLRNQEQARAEVFSNSPVIPEEWISADPSEIFEDVTLYQIMESFKRILDSMPKPSYYELEKFQVTLKEQITFINELFLSKGEYKFSEIMNRLDNRLKVIVTFLALLELAKDKQIRFVQYHRFSDFRVLKAS